MLWTLFHTRFLMFCRFSDCQKALVSLRFCRLPLFEPQRSHGRRLGGGQTIKTSISKTKCRGMMRKLDKVRRLVSAYYMQAHLLIRASGLFHEARREEPK